MDILRGLDGNDTLLAKDNVADTELDCDGGAVPGARDTVRLDATDPAAAGCEIVLF
jgi:hypothetical protein